MADNNSKDNSKDEILEYMRGGFDLVFTRFDRLELKMDRAEIISSEHAAEIEGINKKIKKLDQKIDELANRLELPSVILRNHEKRITTLETARAS